MRARRMTRWGKVSKLMKGWGVMHANVWTDAMEYLRAKTVDLPKKFLDRGRI